MKERKLRVVHVVPVTPRSCGMYETAREIAEEERKLGINAYLYDPRPTAEELKEHPPKQGTQKCPGCGEEFTVGEQVQVGVPRVPDWTPDRGVCTVPLEFLAESDVIISHSGLDAKVKDATTAPYIHVAHGRPRSSFLIEHSGQTAIYSFYKEMGKDERLKAAVTLWPEYPDYWKLIFPEEKVHAFQPPCNLQHWQRTATNYNFGGYRGEINVVCADMWRLDKDPFHIFNAFVLFANKHPGAKLHIYAAKQERGWGILINTMKERGIVGEVLPLITGLDKVYSAADLLITPHNIAVRTIREALACGCQVVAGDLNKYTPYIVNPENLQGYADMMGKAYDDWKEDEAGCIKRNRAMAEKSFDVKETARQFAELARKIAA